MPALTRPTSIAFSSYNARATYDVRGARLLRPRRALHPRGAHGARHRPRAGVEPRDADDRQALLGGDVPARARAGIRRDGPARAVAHRLRLRRYLALGVRPDLPGARTR